MKTIITIGMLLISSLGFAQQLNDKIKDAFKTDDADVLLTEVKDQKANINDCFDNEGVSYNLLSISIKLNRPNIFNALLTAKADLNKICNGKTPLMYSAKYGELNFAKALLKAGADASIKNSEGQTALDYAVKYKKSEIQTMLTTIK